MPGDITQLYCQLQGQLKIRRRANPVLEVKSIESQVVLDFRQTKTIVQLLSDFQSLQSVLSACVCFTSERTNVPQVHQGTDTHLAGTCRQQIQPFLGGFGGFPVIPHGDVDTAMPKLAR